MQRSEGAPGVQDAQGSRCVGVLGHTKFQWERVGCRMGNEEGGWMGMAPFNLEKPF